MGGINSGRMWWSALLPPTILLWVGFSVCLPRTMSSERIIRQRRSPVLASASSIRMPSSAVHLPRLVPQLPPKFGWFSQNCVMAAYTPGLLEFRLSLSRKPVIWARAADAVSN